MKHLKLPQVFNQKLKLFEGYLEPKYFEISWEEFNTLLTNITPFTKRFKDWLIEKGYQALGTYYIMMYKKYSNSVSISISQTNDEWFIIIAKKSQQTNYYKCDQFEGLINFLNTFCPEIN